MRLIYLYLFIAGIFVGSFYNVVALRKVKNESIVFPGSHCMNCNHKLAWYELIPVFSYLFLRGKCKKCKTHISLQYPLIELLTGSLFAFSFYIFGFSYMTLISLVVVSISIITYVTDIKEMIILDEVLIVGSIFLIILYLIFLGIPDTLLRILYGIVLFLIVLTIKLLGDKAFKTESLGWGDVKLSFVSGLVLGIPLGVTYIFIGSFLALPYALIASIKEKEHIIPFGPFLVTAMLLLFWNSDKAIELLNKLIGA